jgi:hypothetical protein
MASLAKRRRFCATAAKVNSSVAPLSPRNRKRSKRRMLLRWAKSISTFLRSKQDCRYAAVLAMRRATSRAFSWMLR